MIVFVLFYVIYYFITKSLFNGVWWLANEFYAFAGIYTKLGVKPESVTKLWMIVYIVILSLPLILTCFKICRKKRFLISYLAVFAFLPVCLVAEIIIDEKLIVDSYSKEYWNENTYMRYYVMDDLCIKLKDGYTDKDVLTELGSYTFKEDNNEDYFYYVYVLDMYYHDICLEIEFDKNTRECIFAQWGLAREQENVLAENAETEQAQ